MPAPVHLSDQMPVPVPERRSFLGLLLAAVGGLVSAALAIPLVRFATFPLRVPSGATSWSDVGKIDEFLSLAEPVARTIDVQRIDGWRSSVIQNGIYVVPAWERQPEGTFFSMPPPGLRRALDRKARQVHLSLPWGHLYEYGRARFRATAPRNG